MRVGAPDGPTIGSLHWYENTDGMGSFVVHSVDENPNELRDDFVKLADIDGDDDRDVVANIAWYENEEGGTTFIKHSLD